MLPIRDENPQINTPYVTYLLIGLNVLCWFLLQGMGSDPLLSESVCKLGLIPGELLGNLAGAIGTGQALPCALSGDPNWTTIVSSMFMHGGWMHIIGNMWFLWIFGNNVEDAMGSLRFLVFYLLCGLAAAGAQMLADTASPIPMVGASGAIGGVMGAYIVLYPRVKVHMLFFFGLIFTFAVPAVLMLGYWIAMQLLEGMMSIGSSGGGVAFWAHIGGFLAGAALIWVFKDDELLAMHPYHGWEQAGTAQRAFSRVRDDHTGWR